MARHDDNCDSGDGGKYEQNYVESREAGMRAAMVKGLYPENLRELEFVLELEDGRVLGYGALCEHGGEAQTIRELCADVSEREGSPVVMMIVADAADVEEAEHKMLEQLTDGPVKDATIPGWHHKGLMEGGGM